MGVIVSVHLLANLGDAFSAFGIGQNSIEVSTTAVLELHYWLPFHVRPIRSRVRTGEYHKASFLYSALCASSLS